MRDSEGRAFGVPRRQKTASAEVVAAVGVGVGELVLGGKSECLC